MAASRAVMRPALEYATSKWCCVVVGPTPPPKNGGWVQQPFLRPPADGIHPYLSGIRASWSTGGPSIQPAGAPPQREPSTSPGVLYCEWYGVCDFVVLSVVEVCADYGGVNVFYVFFLILASSMVLGFVSMSVV